MIRGAGSIDVTLTLTLFFPRAIIFYLHPCVVPLHPYQILEKVVRYITPGLNILFFWVFLICMYNNVLGAEREATLNSTLTSMITSC